MRLPGFVGGSNVLSSTLEDCELSINWFKESAQVGTPKTEDRLRDRPGLRFLFSIGNDPVECLSYLDGRCFGVAGTAFVEIFYVLATNTWSYLVRGTVANDGIDLATIANGGSEASPSMLIISGSLGYTFELTTNTFAAITDPDFPANPVMCLFFAGYFFVFGRNTRQIWWSGLEDPSSWDPLDTIIRSWAADNINFILRNGTHIWVVGTLTSEVLYATGGIDVFAPAQESLIEHGSIARFTGQLMPQGVTCLDQSTRGSAQVVIFRGLQPDDISTYAINLEQASQAGLLNASYAMVIQMEGHIWYLLNNRNETNTFRLAPVFDATEGLWHHWAHWDPITCQWIPFRGLSYAAPFEKHIVGDRLTGAVYELSFSTFSDQLAAI